MKLEYIIKSTENFANLKEMLKVHFNISDRLLLKLKKENKICVNGIPSPLHTILKSGDLVEIYLDFAENNSNIVPVNMHLDIVYEDEAYIVLNKPSGMPVHPSMDHFTDSLSNGVKYYFDECNLKKKIRPVNRLDRNTSGLVVFAKNEYIQECLIRQMKDGKFYKEYIAICDGKLENETGTIDAPIARKEDSIIERCIDESGDHAITKYELLEYNEENNYSVVKCILETGRTHQIRVHMTHMGHPLLGDSLYGHESRLINRQALHAYKLSFIHPVTQEQVFYQAELPEDIRTLLEKAPT